MTSDGLCELEYATFAQKRSAKLAELLKSHPDIEATHPMLVQAHSELCDLIEDMNTWRDYQAANPSDVLDIIKSFEVIASHAQKSTAWLDEVKRTFKDRQEFLQSNGALPPGGELDYPLYVTLP
jgi:hypothetical protein